MPTQAQKLVEKGSPRFRSVYAEVGKAVRKTFANAEEGVLYKLPGWTIPLPKRLVPKQQIGTLDPTRMYVLLREGKSGITLHLWNPLDYHGLDEHRTRLEEAGFQVMVGCLRWTKKSEYPIEQVAQVLRGMKARLRQK